MLELRPTCEHCDKALPPDSAEARICSFECTFCATCVLDVLGSVCPNCGGGFAPRPVRPARNWKGGNCLAKYPASRTRKQRPVDAAAQAALQAAVAGLPPGAALSNALSDSGFRVYPYYCRTSTLKPVPMFALLKSLSSLFSPSLDDIQDRDEKFLAQAVDMCDLENRMRLLDRGQRNLYRGGPYGIFVSEQALATGCAA